MSVATIDYEKLYGDIEERLEKLTATPLSLESQKDAFDSVESCWRRAIENFSKRATPAKILFLGEYPITKEQYTYRQRTSRTWMDVFCVIELDLIPFTVKYRKFDTERTTLYGEILRECVRRYAEPKLRFLVDDLKLIRPGVIVYAAYQRLFHAIETNHTFTGTLFEALGPLNPFSEEFRKIRELPCKMSAQVNSLEDAVFR